MAEKLLGKTDSGDASKSVFARLKDRVVESPIERAKREGDIHGLCHIVGAPGCEFAVAKDLVDFAANEKGNSVSIIAEAAYNGSPQISRYAVNAAAKIGFWEIPAELAVVRCTLGLHEAAEEAFGLGTVDDVKDAAAKGKANVLRGFAQFGTDEVSQAAVSAIMEKGSSWEISQVAEYTKNPRTAARIADMLYADKDWTALGGLLSRGNGVSYPMAAKKFELATNADVDAALKKEDWNDLCTLAYHAPDAVRAYAMGTLAMNGHEDDLRHMMEENRRIFLDAFKRDFAASREGGLYGSMAKKYELATRDDVDAAARKQDWDAILPLAYYAPEGVRAHAIGTLLENGQDESLRDMMETNRGIFLDAFRRDYAAGKPKQNR